MEHYHTIQVVVKVLDKNQVAMTSSPPLGVEAINVTLAQSLPLRPTHLIVFLW